MTKLAPKAQAALDKVVNANTSYKKAKEKFEAELERELETKLESYVSARNSAVQMADFSGVPRTQIGRAMGTTNYKTVQDILEETAGKVTTADSGDRRWSVMETELGWELVITSLGAGAISGSAIVAVVEGDLMYVDGDAFVVPQAYRNDIAEEIIEAIS